MSHLSANDKGDNKMIPRAVHRSPGIYITAEKNSKSSGRRRFYGGRTVSHRLKWGPLPQNEAGRIAQYVWKIGGKKQGYDWWDLLISP